MRKLKATSKQAWGQILQTAARAYRMVPHEATGMLPFLMLDGCEAMLPEEIEHTMVGSDLDYEKAVERHIGQMLQTQELASQSNLSAIQKSKEYFDRNFVRIPPCTYS